MVLYAPNINVGGGLVLLIDLLRALPADRPVHLFLDARIEEKVQDLVQGRKVTWVTPTVFARLAAERSLAAVSAPDGLILCFNGVPPLFGCQGQVNVYIHNKLLISSFASRGVRLKTRLRLGYEKIILFLGRTRVARYFVQTPSMRNSVVEWLSERQVGDAEKRVHVAPFANLSNARSRATLAEDGRKDYQFCYVADGQPHKNHACLFQAMRLLAEQGLTPGLAITLGDHETDLLYQCRVLNTKYGTRIENLGALSHKAVFDLYSKSEALVFPSLMESFGLPLIEAESVNLPILASELDYVRDVCKPQETFNPLEPLSLSRALRRFLETPEPLPEFLTAREFIESLTEQEGDYQ